MRKYHEIKKFWTIALFVSAMTICIYGQKTNPISQWEITFGDAKGRVHENIIEKTVASDGRITYLDKKTGTPAVGQISESDIDEIAGLINRLSLSQAKEIPSGEFNQCIVSLHLPNIYFVLKQNGKTYKLSHCNNSQGKKYEYTLNLSVKQKAVYKELREKLESLFGDEIRNRSETPEKTEGLKNEDLQLILKGKVWKIVIYQQTRNYERTDIPVRLTNYFWNGELTRRGDSSVFDAVWQNEKTGEKVRDTVTLEDVGGEKIVLRRDGTEKENLPIIFVGSYGGVIPQGIFVRKTSNKKSVIISGSIGGLKWAANIEQEISDSTN